MSETTRTEFGERIGICKNSRWLYKKFGWYLD